MEKILIIQTAFIGDVVLATPLIEQMRRFYPNVKIDFLVRKGNESLLENHLFVNKVLIWDKKQKKYSNFYKIICDVRSERYDLIINVQRFLSSGVLCAFSKARAVVGFQKNPLSFLFDKKLPHRLDGTHEVERNLSLIAHLTDAHFQRPKLYPSAADVAKVETELLPQFVPVGDFVTIAPTSVWFTKQLPAEQWLQLIERLSPDISVLLIGGGGDFAACEAIKTSSRRENVHNLCGKLGLLASAALMQRAKMNYANDSAPIHIASAVNAPMTAFFCSTVPAFGFTPLSDERHIIETAAVLPCRPCGLHGKKACPKGHFDCAKMDFDRIKPL